MSNDYLTDSELAIARHTNHRWPRSVDDELELSGLVGRALLELETLRHEKTVLLAKLSEENAARVRLQIVVQAMANFDGRNNNQHLKGMAREALASLSGEKP